MYEKVSVDQAIENGLRIMRRSPRPTYSMEARGYGPNAAHYDCSSFMGSIWEIGSGPATPSMVSVYTGLGFQHLKKGAKLQKGDILVNTNPGGGGHTAMVYNDDCTQLLEFTGPTGNPGPSINNGVYRFSWSEILRSNNSGIRIVKWQSGNFPGKYHYGD